MALSQKTLAAQPCKMRQNRVSYCCKAEEESGKGAARMLYNERADYILQQLQLQSTVKVSELSGS